MSDPRTTLAELNGRVMDRRRFLVFTGALAGTALYAQARGDLALEGTGRSKSDTTQANSQGSVFLNVKPNAKGKRKLRNKGKLQVNAVVTYTEDNEQPETEATSVLLKLKRKGY